MIRIAEKVRQILIEKKINSISFFDDDLINEIFSRVVIGTVHNKNRKNTLLNDLARAKDVFKVEKLEVECNGAKRHVRLFRLRASS